MLHGAGFDEVERRPGDSSSRNIHCFAARLPLHRRGATL
jgi:hypothetical protein